MKKISLCYINTHPFATCGHFLSKFRSIFPSCDCLDLVMEKIRDSTLLLANLCEVADILRTLHINLGTLTLEQLVNLLKRMRHVENLEIKFQVRMSS